MNPIRDLGPCAVIFDGEDLGSTMGGVIFRYTEESKPVYVDQSGVSEVNDIKVGATCSVEVPLTRTSLANLSKVIGNATYVGGKTLEVGVAIGVSVLESAKELVLKPLINNEISEDEDTWLTIYKAYPRVDLELAYNNEGQRIYKVIFKAFPVNGKLWRIGPEHN